MFGALVDYYRRHEDEMPPYGHDFYPVAYFVHVLSDGSPVWVEKKGGKGGGPALALPRWPDATRNVASSLLWGDSRMLLARGDHRGRDREFNEAFVEACRSFAEARPETAADVAAAVAFASDRRFREEVAAEVDIDFGSRKDVQANRLALVHVPARQPIACRWKESVKEHAHAVDAEGRPVDRCLVTGEMDAVCTKHKRMHGHTFATGNMPCQTRWGIIPREVAGMGVKAHHMYTSAFEHASRNGSRSHFGGMQFLAWDSGDGRDASSVLGTLFGKVENPMGALAAVGQPVVGQPVDGGAEKRFCLLVYEKVMRRTVVVEWCEAGAWTVARNVEAYFKRLGHDGTHRLPLWRLAQCDAKNILKGGGIETREVDPGVKRKRARALLRSALFGERMPVGLARKATERVFRELMAGVHAVRGAGLGWVVTPARTAVISAAMKERRGMDEKPSPAYWLGRWFAVVIQAQRKAIDKSTLAGTVASFVGNPARDVVALRSKLAYYVNRIEKNSGVGLGRWYEKQAAEALAQVGTSLPPGLGVDEQGDFVVGMASFVARSTPGQDNASTSEVSA